MKYPPEVIAKFREWGRIGGKRTPREAQRKAGLASALKRWRYKPRCPTCHQTLKTPARLIKEKQEAIRKARQDNQQVSKT